MVDLKFSSRGRWSSLQTANLRAHTTGPPIGNMVPPPLIGHIIMDPLTRAHREKKNTATYIDKTWSCWDWNVYVAFGIQDLESITEYFEERKTAMQEANNLRMARYY